MEEADIIISGPEHSGSEYWGSLAEFLIPRLKSQPKDFIIQVDYNTNETITAHEFLRQSLEVTEGLVEFGLKQGDVVIFVCPNNIRSHVAAAGILFSGGVLAPIDQNSKSFELQHFFKEFKPKYIICERAKGKEIQTCVKLVNLEPKIILIDSSDSSEEFFSWEDIRTKVDLDNYVPRKVKDPKKNVAVINCSSGSTGMPKGVALSHYSLLFNLSSTESMKETTLHINPEMRQAFLLTSPLFWISGTVLFLYSCFFGQTRLIPKSTAVEDILKGIEIGKPFFLMLAPPTLLFLVEHPNFRKYDVSSVKVIFAGGAILSSTIATKVKETWKDIILRNSYGLTEVCGGVTMVSGSDNPSSIGKLLPEVKVEVVDLNTGKSLGPNQIGECRIKTKKMMIGYYNNEEATKSAFDENGWLRTGDLVYYDEDGLFYVVSRIQEIIKYLSYQISPAELESYIISLPGVKDVAVVPVPHETESNHIRALVVKDPDFDISADVIIQGVKENFAEYKQLSEGVQFVDVLPRTEVGKLRRLEAQKMVKI